MSFIHKFLVGFAASFPSGLARFLKGTGEVVGFAVASFFAFWIASILVGGIILGLSDSLWMSLVNQPVDGFFELIHGHAFTVGAFIIIAAFLSWIFLATASDGVKAAVRRGDEILEARNWKKDHGGALSYAGEGGSLSVTEK